MKKIIEHALTQGEINSSYICVSKYIDFFPVDTIGGPNKNGLAKSNLIIFPGSGDPVETDIAGDKMVFRKRGWLSEFIGLHNLKAGDQIAIEYVEPYRYKVYPKRSNIRLENW